jgi:hypothetical protein
MHWMQAVPQCLPAAAAPNDLEFREEEIGKMRSVR